LIWAILLAAGESKRMGTPKQLLPYGDKTIIEAVIDHMTHSRLDGVLVVLGAHREKIEKIIAGLPVKTVYNPRYEEGMLSSVQTGFSSLPKDARAVLVFLGDQPMVPSSVIDRIIETYRSGEKGIVLPVFGGTRGHPVLIDTKYSQEVAALDPEIGLRELIHNHPEDIMEVDADTPTIIEDIDTPEDYNKLKN
jgi:molybdenum cofactor cytidylyltransferase